MFLKTLSTLWFRFFTSSYSSHLPLDIWSTILQLALFCPKFPGSGVFRELYFCLGTFWLKKKNLVTWFWISKLKQSERVWQNQKRETIQEDMIHDHLRVYAFTSILCNQISCLSLCFWFLINFNRNFIVLFSYKHGEENRWQPTLTQPLTRLQDGDETSRILLRLIRATPIHELPFLLAWLRDRWVFHSYFHDLFW